MNHWDIINHPYNIFEQWFNLTNIEIRAGKNNYIPYKTMDIIIYFYHQVSNIRWTSVGNKIVHHSDVVGASPVGAAPTTSSFST